MVRIQAPSENCSPVDKRVRVGASDFQHWIDGTKVDILPALTADGRAVAYSRQEVEAFLRNGGPQRKKPGRKPFAQKQNSA